MEALSVCYAFSHRLQDEANAAGRNYWYVYVREILSRLGVTARPLELSTCAQMDALARVGVLFLGDFHASALPSGAGDALTQWVAAGGVLIGSATEGLDMLFGIAAKDAMPQEHGPFSINGHFHFRDCPVTQDCRAPVEPDQKLIITSPLRVIHATTSGEIAHIFTCDPDHPDDGSCAHDAAAAAITHRQLGEGHAFYFAFNVAQTMWVIQQGRPVDRDYDADGYLRTPDACVLGDNSRRVPYADALHFLIGNMIGRRPVPVIHQIPPRDGHVSPALLFFGGDDEADPRHQLPASDFMAARGLPYHINAMLLDGRFAIDAHARERIEANGHEIALHYNFVDGFTHPCGFTNEDVAEQARLFREAFGRSSVAGNAHYCRWSGWAEPARWMRQAGCRADNSYFNWRCPPTNPVNNIGFAFGSAFPWHFWDDAEHGNTRIDFLELPIIAYEVGYEGEEFCPEKIREALALAVRYHLTLDFFWHPVYVASYPACQKAVDELVRLTAEMAVPPVLMGPDELWRWWDARSRGVIRNARQAQGRISFEAECEYDKGFVVKIPTGQASARAVAVDGAPARFESAREFGQHWALIPLAPGSHAAELDL